MKKLVYFTSIFCGFILGGCTLPQMIKLAKNQNLTASPNPLEVHKDTVVFDLSASLPVKMLKPNTTYTLNTFYKYGDQERALEPLTFKSVDFPQASTQQPKLSKKFSFPYSPALKNGLIQIEGVASKGSKSKTTPRLDVATGILTTSKLVQDNYYVSFADHGYNNQEEIIPVIIPNFLFDQGSSVLRKTEISGLSGKELDAFIASKNITRTVTITGTHSPEGRERVNSKLSEDRAAAIEKFYRAEMKKYDYQGLSDNIRFVLKPVVDDWTSFKEALKNYSGITEAEKSEFNNIINAGGTFPQVEEKLSKLPTYKKVYNDIYPGLRTAKTEIFIVKKKKTDIEISVLAKQILNGQAGKDALSMEEFLYAASLTPSLEEKANLYQAATKMGTSWVAHNNLAATWLSLGLQNRSNLNDYAEQAATQLEIAARLRNSNEVNANMATVALIQGNPWKAFSFSNRALNGASNEISRGVNGVKAACEIHMAKYSQAIASASAAAGTPVNLFNRGLAQLLTKDYGNAYASFLEATRSGNTFAMGYYGAAVAAARQGKETELLTNLVTAIKLDPSLKETASSDMEFSKWSGTDSFRNALK